VKVTRITAEAAKPGGDELFIGEVQLQPVLAADDGLDILVVRFSPGARTYLHAHEGVQVLHCVEGRGILATENERNIVTPGDVVHVPAGELHWHGATADDNFVHLSIRPPGATRWTKIDPLAPTDG
jgi:quercetin dioxygenase-like cupin family protein